MIRVKGENIYINCLCYNFELWNRMIGEICKMYTTDETMPKRCLFSYCSFSYQKSWLLKGFLHKGARPVLRRVLPKKWLRPSKNSLSYSEYFLNLFTEILPIIDKHVYVPFWNLLRVMFLVTFCDFRTNKCFIELPSNLCTELFNS